MTAVIVGVLSHVRLNGAGLFQRLPAEVRADSARIMCDVLTMAGLTFETAFGAVAVGHRAA